MRQIFCLPLILYLSLSKAQLPPTPTCPPGTCGSPECYGSTCGNSSCCSDFFQFCADPTGRGLCCENTQTYMGGACCLTGTSNICNGACCAGNCTTSGACQSTQAGCQAIGGTGMTCETEVDCCKLVPPRLRGLCVTSGASSCRQGCCIEN